ncbi:MAG TPA: hypothetical protein VG934_00935 [Candidatus Paceibacterota bacterium]|nr:hypothetical protein [Candidatus Paceibacterota bacterium]
MQFIKDNKLYIGIIAILLLGVWAYFSFFGGSGSSSLLTAASPTSPLSPDVLSTLSSLNTIKLDPSIFSDPTFTALSDYSVAIPTESVGRRNPFSPI